MVSFRCRLMAGVVAMVRRVLLISGVLASAAIAGDNRLIDDSGYTLVLNKPAQRVISLAPHLTEQVFSAGAGDRLIATVNYSDYPEAALALPRVGTYKKVNYELISELKPDLILAFGGNGMEMVNRLRALGFKVYMDEPQSLEDVALLLEDLGLLLGAEEQAKAAAADFRQRYQALQNQYQQQEAVQVFYQVWNQPLLTINGQHLISKVIQLCGGENIFADAIPMAPKISVETVIRRNPEAIVASGHGDARPEWLDEWQQWTVIEAVQKKQLFFIPPDILQRHTTRILDGAEMMCEYLQQVRYNKTERHGVREKLSE